MYVADTMSGKISRIDAIKLIDLLKDFEKLCEERQIKFKEYTPEQLMEFLIMYKNYRRGQIDPPPF
jgi:hypothetical protein